MVQPRPVSLTQVDEAGYEGAFEPEPLLIVGPVPGGGGGGGSTAWNDITGKPTTFTPSAHTQSIASITGLQAELDSKATPDEIPTTPGDIGAATAAQGAKADTAVQPAAIANFVPTSRTVAGKALTADVTLAKADVGLGSVDNTADSAKPVSTAQQTALNGKVSALNGVTGLWKGTQAAYNALTPDANVIYIIQG